MERVPVLVTGVGSCGVGEGVARTIAALPDHYTLLACNADRDATQLYSAAQAWIVPTAGKPNYLDSILSICNEGKARFVIPGSEDELPILAAARDRFEEIGCEVLCNNPDVLEIGSDKWRTFEFLKGAGFDTPKILGALNAVDAAGLPFPCVVKPRRGFGNKEVRLVRNPEEFEVIRRYFEFYEIEGLVQVHAGSVDEEYTASVLLSKTSEVLGSIATRRRLIGGATRSIDVEEFPRVNEEVVRVGRALEATGPINIQCRVVGDSVHTFEINPRFSGSAPFRAQVGFNEAHILIQHQLRGEIPPFSIRTGTFGVRGFTETIVDRGVAQSLPNVDS